MNKEEIANQINTYSYWEHFKAAKDLSFILPPEHPKRKAIEETMQSILKTIKP